MMSADPFFDLDSSLKSDNDFLVENCVDRDDEV